MDAADKEWCVDRVKEAAEKIEEVRALVEADLLADVSDVLSDVLIVAFGRLGQATYSAVRAAKAVEAL